MSAVCVRRKLTSFVVLLACTCFAQAAFAETKDMDCQKQSPTTYIQLAPTDQATANHLSLDRQLAIGTSVTLDVCAADLAVKAGSDNHLHITIDRTSASAEEAIANYVQALDVISKEATLKLRLPEKAKAKVTAVIPTATPTLEINLVKGNVSVDTGKIEGNRTINLVSGQVNFVGNPDSYQALGTHIVLGSMHDHRPGGKSHHFMVTNTLPGSGKGNVEINVVKGSADLSPSAN